MALAHRTDRLTAATAAVVTKKRERYLRAVSKLDALSPMKVLSRGYAFAEGNSGVILTDASSLFPGDRIRLTLYRGKLRCIIDKVDMTKDADND